MTTEREPNYWRRTLRRRTVLRGGLMGAAALPAYLLVGCGDDDDGGGGFNGGTTPGGSSASPSASKMPTGGTLTALVASDPTSVDPHFGQGGGDAFFWMIHDNLVNYNKKGELDASISLAQKWEQPDPHHHHYETCALASPSTMERRSMPPPSSSISNVPRAKNRRPRHRCSPSLKSRRSARPNSS